MIGTSSAYPALFFSVTISIKSSYKGLQAFYFQSSDTAPCDQAPHDGILIQVPANLKDPVKLRIDDAIVYLNSTIFVTAQASKFLTISTLEGTVVAYQAGTGNGGTIIPGSSMKFPLDANLHVSGPPTLPAFFSTDAVRFLPVRILPNTSVAFETGFPLGVTPPTIDDWTVVRSNFTVSGDSPKINCIKYKDSSETTKLACNDNTMWWESTKLTKSGQGVYTTKDTFQSTFNPAQTGTSSLDFSVMSPTHITGSATVTDPPCTWKFHLDFTCNAAPSPTATP